MYITTLLFTFLKGLLVVVPVLLAVAFMTLLERKLMAAVQRRRGPNVVGIYGLLQPFADGLKLIVKETVLPSTSNIFLFIFAPILSLFLSLLNWAVIPFQKGLVIVDIDVGILYLFAISSLGVYAIIIAGWASNSKYAFLGALRSAAQMISYEVSIGLIVMSVLICAGSLNLTSIVLAQASCWYFVGLFPLMLLFFISALAETNRPPFDLPEAEGELVAGYSVEYSAAGFALFFIAEYSNIIMMSTLTVVLFFGGWLPPFDFLSFVPGVFWFVSKELFFICLFIMVRAVLPRYRYDQLMTLGWKVFLPVSLAWVVFIAAFLIVFQGLPVHFYNI